MSVFDFQNFNIRNEFKESEWCVLQQGLTHKVFHKLFEFSSISNLRKIKEKTLELVHWIKHHASEHRVCIYFKKTASN